MPTRRSAASRPAGQQKAAARVTEKKELLRAIAAEQEVFLRALPAIIWVSAQYEWAFRQAEKEELNTDDLHKALAPYDIMRRQWGLPADADLWMGRRPHHEQEAGEAGARLTRDLLDRPPRSRALFEFLVARLIECCSGPPSDDLKRLTQLVLHYSRFGKRSLQKPATPARERAREYIEQNPRASTREIARHSGVHHSTVAEWKKTKKL
jgi:hypothetical protein